VILRGLVVHGWRPGQFRPTAGSVRTQAPFSSKRLPVNITCKPAVQKAHGHFVPGCDACKTSTLPPFLIFQRHGKARVLAAQMLARRQVGGQRLPRKASTPNSELAKEVLSYFLRNPHAADSLEGVTRWRLIEERVHRELESTDKALNWLVHHGFLMKVSSEWTESVYQLNEVNRSAAQRFMSESTKPRKPRREWAPAKQERSRGNDK
jgi:hypothetical protein